VRILFFILYGFSSLAFAEPPISALSVPNLNKMMGILNDPTMMNANFRRALGGLNQQNGNGVIESVETDVDEDGELLLPNIEMVAKVLNDSKPNTVVFKTRNKYLHFEQGQQVSIIVNHEVVTLSVEEISKYRTRLRIMPFNKVLIFN